MQEKGNINSIVISSIARRTIGFQCYFFIFPLSLFAFSLLKDESLRSTEKTYALSYTLVVRKNRYGQRQRSNGGTL